MLRRELGFRDITLFSVVSIVGVRWVGPAARAGPGSILLWVLAALTFIIPIAIVVTALTVRDPEAGGLYRWTRRDFGPWHGFLAFWMYWMAGAVWYPGAAFFCANAATAALGPRYSWLGENSLWLVSVSLVAIWAAIGTNIVGLRIGKWTENLGAIAAWTLGILIAIAAARVWRQQGSATSFHLLPDFSWGTVNFWAPIAFAMTGFEVMGMMGGELRNPARDLPRAAWASSAIATTFYVGTTAALLILISPEAMSELNAMTQAGQLAANILSVPWLAPAAALMVILSMVGQFGGIGSAVARMPFAAGADHLLPPRFALLHPRWATPWYSMVVLGVIGSLLLVLAQLGDTARAAYQTIISMTFISGLLPYVYMFGSGWKVGKRWSAVLGWAVTAIGLVVSLIPPANVQQVWLFELKLFSGTAAIIGSAFLVYHRQTRHNKAETLVAKAS